jgi:hypothetical protein
MTASLWHSGSTIVKTRQRERFEAHVNLAARMARRTFFAQPDREIAHLAKTLELKGTSARS